ncbi:interleukin-8-like [Rhinoraja longicauda]
MGSSGVNLRCACIKTSSTFIHPKFMENINIIPKGPHCGNVEIIATLQNDNRVCLDPKSIWVQKIINKLISSPKADEVREGKLNIRELKD